MTMNAVCTHMDGLMPRIDSQTRTAMMTAATSQFTMSGNVLLGKSTKRK